MKAFYATHDHFILIAESFLLYYRGIPLQQVRALDIKSLGALPDIATGRSLFSSLLFSSRPQPLVPLCGTL